MKSRENISCERTTDSHCIKSQVPFLSWSLTALPHCRCKKKAKEWKTARVWMILYSQLNPLLQTFWLTKKSTRESRTGIKQQIHFAGTVLTDKPWRQRAMSYLQNTVSGKVFIFLGSILHLPRGNQYLFWKTVLFICKNIYVWAYTCGTPFSCKI